MLTFSTVAQTDFSNVIIRSTQAGESVFMMDCADDFVGGNVTVSVGKDGVLLVDNMFAQAMPKLLGKIKTLSDKPIRYEINSHFHGDHTNGNEVLSSTATIIAHTNLRTRFINQNPPAIPAMLPHITFTDSMTLYFNDEEIKLIHLPNGHTDNDVVVYFTKSNVVHMGDMFFFKMFPAVYTKGGGNIKQLIINVEKVINTIPADAKVVPGHGDLATADDLKSYLTMLKETTGTIEKAITEDKSLEQIKKEKLLAKYDALGAGGAQTTDQYTEMLYKLLTGK
jgi:cyclase